MSPLPFTLDYNDPSEAVSFAAHAMAEMARMMDVAHDSMLSRSHFLARGLWITPQEAADIMSDYERATR